LVDAYVSVVR